MENRRGNPEDHPPATQLATMPPVPYEGKGGHGRKGFTRQEGLRMALALRIKPRIHADRRG